MGRRWTRKSSSGSTSTHATGAAAVARTTLSKNGLYKDAGGRSGTKRVSAANSENRVGGSSNHSANTNLQV